MTTRISYLASAICCVVIGAAQAQTWDGGGGRDNWTTGLNWVGDVAPVNNGTADIIMAGTNRLTPLVDVNQNIRSLMFDVIAGAFDIGGNPLTIGSGGIQNYDTDVQTISTPIVVSTSQIWRAESGPLVIAGPTVTLLGNLIARADSGYMTISASISGGGRTLLKEGSGVVNLAGANTYTGGTSITAGTLQLQADNVMPDTGSVSLSLGGTFDLNGRSDTLGALNAVSGSSVYLGSGTLTLSGNSSVSGVISGSGGLAIGSAGTATLSGANTYTGTTTVNGTLQLSASERLADASDLVINATFSLGSYHETVDQVILQSGTITGSGMLTGNVYNVQAGTINTILSGTADLIKTTTGTVTLNSANTYAGATTVSAGVLALGANNSLPANMAPVTVSGGTLRLGNGVSQLIDVLNGAGNILFVGGNSLTIGGNNGSSSFSGAVTGGGTITKSGTGTLTLGGTHFYTGATIVNDGVLQMAANNVLPDTAAVTVNAPGVLNLIGFSDVVGALDGSGNVSLGNGTLTVGGANVSTTYSGVISGIGNLSKIGGLGNTLTLAGANTFTGLTTVSGGTLRIAASERLADESNLTINGGKFDLQAFDETVTVVTLQNGSIIGSGALLAAALYLEEGSVSAILAGSAALTKSTSGDVVLTNNNIYAGGTNVEAGALHLGANNALPLNTADVAVAGGATIHIGYGISQSIDELTGSGSLVFGDSSLFVVGSNHGSSTFSGVISGSGTLGKSGAGSFTLTGANTYTGTTTVSGGTLRIGGANERLADASDVTINGGTFDLQSFNETVSVVTLQSGSITGTGTLTGNAYNVESGSVGAVLAGTSGLMKLTAGTVTLGKPNTYAGGTSINGGVLEISSDTNLGAAGTAVTFDSGTLRFANSFAFSRPVTLDSGGGTFDTVGTTTVTSAISGAGTLTKKGLGTLVLNSVSPALGGLVVDTGELQLPAGGTLNVVHDVTVGAAGFMSLDGGLINAGAFAIDGEINLRSGARLNGPISNSGVLSGQGRLSGALTNNVSGEVRIGNAESLHFAGATAHANAGLVEVVSGEIEFDTPVSSAASTGLIVARDASLRFDGGLTNSGSMALSFGTSDVFGAITNNAAANLVVSGGSHVTFYNDIQQNGIFRVSRIGSTVGVAVVLGAFTGSGGSSGGGDIFFEGDLRPGDSPATVVFDNNVAFGTGAKLEIEIGGVAAGSQYDVVNIGGTATLNGTLGVSLIDPLGGTNMFQPQLGNVFEFATAADGFSGSFARVQFPGLGPLLEMELLQSANELFLAVVPEMAGDYNANGVVDAADYIVWRDTLGQTGIGLAADGTGSLGTPDGVVDQLDRQFWRAHFGQTAGLGATAGLFSRAIDAVPEPRAWPWLLIGAKWLSSRRCPRRRIPSLRSYFTDSHVPGGV